MTNYRQAQGPYSGDVAPAGSLIVLQEEFTFAGQQGSGIVGPGSSPLPSRWRPYWASLLGATDPAFRWVDGIQQRLTQYGQAAPDPGFGWQGAVLPFPAIELEEVDPGFAWAAFLTAFARVGFGPSNVLGERLNIQQYAALVISGADIANASNDAANLAGIAIEVESPASDVDTWAFAHDSFNPNVFPVAQAEIPTPGAHGFLLRCDMVIERFLVDPGPPPVFEEETELAFSFSTDEGRSWWHLYQTELKGGAAERPRSIGFAISNYTDTVGGFQSTQPLGGFDWLRVYRRPYAEGSIFLNPDGGRNWP